MTHFNISPHLFQSYVLVRAFYINKNIIEDTNVDTVVQPNIMPNYYFQSISSARLEKVFHICQLILLAFSLFVMLYVTKSMLFLFLCYAVSARSVSKWLRSGDACAGEGLSPAPGVRQENLALKFLKPKTSLYLITALQSPF